MAFFAIAPLLCALVQNEIQMTLYMHQIFGSTTANGALVISGYNKTNFGDTFVLNWPIRDGPDTSAKLLGHAQGFHMNTKPDNDGRNWFMSTNLVFSDER